MNATAVDGNRDNNAPPFECRAREFDSDLEIFPGYYDTYDDEIEQSEHFGFLLVSFMNENTANSLLITLYFFSFLFTSCVLQ